jgi:hypothetical protein
MQFVTLKAVPFVFCEYIAPPPVVVPTRIFPEKVQFMTVRFSLTPPPLIAIPPPYWTLLP